MIPQGTPAKSCSARWQSNAFSSGSSAWPAIASSRVAVATSSAALLASPPPYGRVDSMTASKPLTFF